MPDPVVFVPPALTRRLGFLSAGGQDTRCPSSARKTRDGVWAGPAGDVVCGFDPAGDACAVVFARPTAEGRLEVLEKGRSSADFVDLCRRVGETRTSSSDGGGPA